jgi:Tfp pilus assembly PilM family ATPase
MKPIPREERKQTFVVVKNVKEINNEKIKLNLTRSKNEKMRREIDALRKEL